MKRLKEFSHDKKYVFDLDNTLVFTDNLNTKCYNQILQEHGFPPITDAGRITKDRIKEHLVVASTTTINDICRKKQKLFISNLHETQPNEDIIEIMKSKNKRDVAVYTGAEPKRAKAMLDYFKLTNNKSATISKTANIEKDIRKLCIALKCDKSQLVFFDDDQALLKTIQEIIV